MEDLANMALALALTRTIWYPVDFYCTEIGFYGICGINFFLCSILSCFPFLYEPSELNVFIVSLQLHVDSIHAYDEEKHLRNVYIINGTQEKFEESCVRHRFQWEKLTRYQIKS